MTPGTRLATVQTPWNPCEDAKADCDADHGLLMDEVAYHMARLIRSSLLHALHSGH